MRHNSYNIFKAIYYNRLTSYALCLQQYLYEAESYQDTISHMHQTTIQNWYWL